MYATIRRYRLDPKLADEVIQRARQVLLPVVSKVPGFIAFYEINQGDGVIASVSLYEDKAGAEEANRRALELVRTDMTSLLPSLPEITVGEVAFYEQVRQAAK